MSDEIAPAVTNEDSPRGFAFAFAAYFMWGFLPLYLKMVAHIPPLEVVAHRVVWSLPITFAFSSRWSLKCTMTSSAPSIT